MKKIIAIILTILFVCSIAVAEEPATAGMYGQQAPDYPSGWYVYNYEYAYYYDEDTCERSNYHSHHDSEPHIQVKGKVKEDIFGDEYCKAYCTICGCDIEAAHYHTYVYDIEEGSIMNGIVKGHWTIKKCNRSHCNKEEATFEPHDITKDCDYCGYEVNPEVTFIEGPADTTIAVIADQDSGWYCNGYESGYYFDSKTGYSTEIHSHHDTERGHILVKSTVKEDGCGDTYVDAYCCICGCSIRAAHVHSWNQTCKEGSLMKGIYQGHWVKKTCTDSNCGKEQLDHFEAHDCTEQTSIDLNNIWHRETFCNLCGYYTEEICEHKSGAIWKEEDGRGAWYCSYCGTRVTEFEHDELTVPSATIGGTTYPRMLVRHNPNTLYTGTFTASKYCYVAPWSASVIAENAITVFDGLKYYQTNEYGAVILELLDSETGAVVFAHADDVSGIKDILISGEEVNLEGIEPTTTTGEWVNLPDWIFRIYDENCEHDWRLIFYNDEYSGNYTIYCKCSKCNSTQRYFNIFSAPAPEVEPIETTSWWNYDNPYCATDDGNWTKADIGGDIICMRSDNNWWYHVYENGHCTRWGCGHNCGHEKGNAFELIRYAVACDGTIETDYQCKWCGVTKSVTETHESYDAYCHVTTITSVDSKGNTTENIGAFLHDFEDGRCTTCGHECSHEWTEEYEEHKMTATCTICGKQIEVTIG